MKKYNNSNNDKLDNNIDRYDDDDDNENDNYDNNSNKSRFQVKSARFTRFFLELRSFCSIIFSFLNYFLFQP